MLIAAKTEKIRVWFADTVEPAPADLEDEDVCETIELNYWVGEDKTFDSIGLDANGEDKFSPKLALTVADAIVKLEKWSRSKSGKAEIFRIRAIVIEKSAA